MRSAHGATGKGNDQVRFELGYYALKPDIKIIAPWREWDLTSRTKLLEFAEKHQIPIAKDKRGEAPFTVDANLLHSSSEGKVLEDPSQEADSIVFMRTISPEEAPDKATYVEIGFEKGDAVSIDGKALSPATLLTQLNALGKANGIGRLDLVENRFVGMKSRGIYETPGGTILLAAHRGMESITLDRGAAHLKDEIMPRYAELIYNGFWFSPEREMLQALIDKSQEFVTGTVRLKLYKGNVAVVGRSSPYSLYSEKLVTFEDDQGAYDQKDAQGFIKLNALRLRTLAMRKRQRRNSPMSRAGRFATWPATGASVSAATLAWEMAALAQATLSPPPFPEDAVRGDGQPVIVIPGFLAPDMSTARLRVFLERQNFRPHSWTCGFNVGPMPKLSAKWNVMCRNSPPRPAAP